MLDLVKTRREFHQIPELGWEEFETAKKIREIIKDLTKDRPDVEITEHKTGTLVYVPANKKKEGKVLTIGYRADIDGLPIKEMTNLPYQSKHKGLGHMCGHDIHITTGLGVLEQILKHGQTNNFLFLFQPDEEGHNQKGGSKEMYEQAILPKYKVDQFYAYHNTPEYEPGVVSVKEGAFFASGTGVRVVFEGVSGHAAMPHKTHDALVAAAEFVLSAQTIVSRRLNPREGNVFTIGIFKSGEVVNSVSGSAELEGSLRIVNDETIPLAKTYVQEVAEGIAKAHHVKVTVTFEDCGGVYRPVVNNHELTQNFMDYMKNRKDVKFIETPDVTMTSEDFGYITQVVPSVMFWVGAGGKEKGWALHNPEYAPDDSWLPHIVEVMGDYLTQLA